MITGACIPAVKGREARLQWWSKENLKLIFLRLLLFRTILYLLPFMVRTFFSPVLYYQQLPYTFLKVRRVKKRKRGWGKEDPRVISTVKSFFFLSSTKEFPNTTKFFQYPTHYISQEEHFSLITKVKMTNSGKLPVNSHHPKRTLHHFSIHYIIQN